MRLTQVIANVLAAAFVAHDHLVITLAAPGDAMQQCRAVTRGATALEAQILPRLSRSMAWIFSKVPQLM